MQYLVLYLEFDFHSRKGKSVDAFFAVLIRWTRILLQHFFQRRTVVCRNLSSSSSGISTGIKYSFVFSVKLPSAST